MAVTACSLPAMAFVVVAIDGSEAAISKCGKPGAIAEQPPRSSVPRSTMMALPRRWFRPAPGPRSAKRPMRLFPARDYRFRRDRLFSAMGASCATDHLAVEYRTTRCRGRKDHRRALPPLLMSSRHRSSPMPPDSGSEVGNTWSAFSLAKYLNDDAYVARAPCSKGQGVMFGRGVTTLDGLLPPLPTSAGGRPCPQYPRVAAGLLLRPSKAAKYDEAICSFGGLSHRKRPSSGP